MLYLFIAVLAVLLIMNVFMLFVLRQMAGATGRQVEKDAGRLFGIYEEMLEEKSRQLEELCLEEEQIRERLKARELQQAASGEKGQTFAPVPPGKQAEFHDASFARTYNRVKETFSMPVKEAAEQFCENIPKETEEQRSRRECLESIRAALDFDNLYRISILETTRQKRLLEEIFTGEQAGILKEWRESGQGTSVTDLSDWLDVQLAFLAQTVVVKVSSAGMQPKEQPDGPIVWEEDESICEGVKILYKDRLYDYSI